MCVALSSSSPLSWFSVLARLSVRCVSLCVCVFVCCCVCLSFVGPLCVCVSAPFQSDEGALLFTEALKGAADKRRTMTKGKIAPYNGLVGLF